MRKDTTWIEIKMMFKCVLIFMNSLDVEFSKYVFWEFGLIEKIFLSSIVILLKVQLIS